MDDSAEKPAPVVADTGTYPVPDTGTNRDAYAYQSR